MGSFKFSMFLMAITIVFARNAAVELPPEQAVIIAKAREALTTIADKSARAKELLAFYDQNAVKAKILSNNTTMVVEPLRTPTWFIVVVDPRVVERWMAVFIYGRFDCGNRVLVLNETTARNEILGLLIAHELSHAEDCVIRGEPPNLQPIDPLWFIGERNAYQTVYVILNEMTGGGWKTLVEASQERREAIVTRDGGRPEAFFFGTTERDVSGVEALFNRDLNIEEMDFLLTQLNVDTGMTNVAVQSTRLGLDNETVFSRELDFLAAFFDNFRSASLPLVIK